MEQSDNKPLDFEELTEGCRYSGILTDVAGKLKATMVLRLDYESDYQGFVDTDILLANGQVFSLNYSYGSCSGCDDWEARYLSDFQIALEMIEMATIFSSVKEWSQWRKMVKAREQGK